MNPDALYSLTEYFLLENNCYSEVTTKLLDDKTTLRDICKSGDNVDVACIIYRIFNRIPVEPPYGPLSLSESVKWICIRNKWYDYVTEHKLW